MSLKKIFFLTATILIIGFCIISNPKRNGDGHEYSLISKAFINHQSPNVTSKDIADRIIDIQIYPNSNYILDLFKDMQNDIDSNKSQTELHQGLFRSKNGLYFGYHYWFYSMLVAIIEMILNILHLNPLAAFQLTNGLFLLLGIGIILKNEKDYAVIKSLLFLSGGVIYYLKWTHPEVMIYTCLFMFYYYLTKNKYKKSILFLAIASTQVISLTLLYLFIPLWIYIFEKKSFKKIVVGLIKNIWMWILAFFSISSLLFYYYNFSRFTIIGGDYSDIGNINFLRFISYWFDLDQGVWVGAPWIIFAFLFHKYSQKESNIKLLFSLLIAIVICLPLLTNKGINAAQSVFHRYALYSISPLIAYFCSNFSNVFNNKLKLLIVLSTSIFFSYYYSGPFSTEDNLNHKIWTNYILNKYPSLYNPYPDIYIQRTYSPELWYRNVYILEDKKNNLIKKIIYSNKIKKEELIQNLKNKCYGFLSNTEKLPFNLPQLKQVSTYQWTYINTPLKCNGLIIHEPAQTFKTVNQRFIEFNKSSYPDFVKGIDGFSHAEEWGTWLDGTNALLIIDGKFSKVVKLKITMHAFKSLENKQAKLKVNGIEKIISINDLKTHEYEIDFHFNEAPKLLAIEFIQPDAKSPESMGINSDKRILGLGLTKLEWL